MVASIAMSFTSAAPHAEQYQVFDQTPAAVAVFRGPEHCFAYVNEAYARLFPGRELLGRNLADVQPEAVQQGFSALLDGVYQTGTPFVGTELPLAIRQADGSSRAAFFTFTYQAYRERGEIVGVSVFAFDVSDQVHGRRARDLEQQRLRQLFMEAPAAICILHGPNLVFELVNPRYQAIFRGRPLEGRPLLEALPEIVDTVVAATMRRVYESGESHEEAEMLIPLVREDGVTEERYFNYIQQARRNEDGHVDGVLVFAFEVTEQVRARKASEAATQTAQALAAEIIATNGQLTRTNIDLDNFIYTASHDLRAPISNLEGLLHVLQGELPAPTPGSEVPAILGMMQDAVDRFTRTIVHLTDLSKLQKEHEQPASEVLLRPILEDARADLAPLVAETGATIDLDVDAVTTVTFTAKNLRSVAYNLLGNALKYRDPARPPHVRVRARLEGDAVALEFQDNGLGLDLSRERGLFGMFRRYHTHVEGSGIGLYMVKRMLENAGGRIEVRSQVGEGSTFTVYFQR